MPNRPITAIRKSKPCSSSVDAEGQPQLAGHGVHADGGQREAEHHRGDGLERRLLAHADEAAEGRASRPRRIPAARTAARTWRPAAPGSVIMITANSAPTKDEVKAAVSASPALALLRHRIAVEGGRHRPRLARDVEQDRGDGAAEQRAPVDAGQHDDRRGRRHREGQRQQDGHAVGAAQARQHADDDAEHDADDHQQQVERLQRRRRSRETDCRRLRTSASSLSSVATRCGATGSDTRDSASSGPFGSGTRNQISNIRKVTTGTPTATGDRQSASRTARAIA